VISASMCWGYFDMDRMKVELPRLLRSGGRLLIASLRWVSDGNPVAVQTEKLVAKYNPLADRPGRSSGDKIVPAWSLNSFRLITHNEFKAELRFSRESWRGRLRASKWIALPSRQNRRRHLTVSTRPCWSGSRPLNSTSAIALGFRFLNPSEPNDVRG